jgi:predicted nucleic acid-binding protein
LLGIVDEVFAVMNHRRVNRILSFDRGFDGHPGVVRVV